MYAAGNRRPNSATVRSRHTAGAPDGEAVFCLFVCSLRCAGNPLATVYRASDGRQFWLLGQEAQRHWPATAKALGRPEWISDGECVFVVVATQRTALQRSATDQSGSPTGRGALRVAVP